MKRDKLTNGVIIIMNIRENVKLSGYTSFKIGGRAKYFVTIKQEQELNELWEFLYKHNLDYFVLGEGTNLLISDEGFDGVVIKLNEKSHRYNEEEKSINVSAGFNLDELVKICIKKNVKGFENLSGIPGTVGGAIRGNAGAYQTEIKDLIKSVTFYDKGKTHTIDNNDCLFAYRDSIFKHTKSQSVILSAEFNCGKKTNDIESLIKTRESVISKREQKQPNEYPNAGSFFKNPIIPKELVPGVENIPMWEIDDYFMKLSSAWLIENAGLKGYRYNDAGVSEKHSLFIVNYGSAKASDVITVMKYVQEAVKDRFWINLEPEVQLIGFEYIT